MTPLSSAWTRRGIQTRVVLLVGIGILSAISTLGIASWVSLNGLVGRLSAERQLLAGSVAAHLAARVQAAALVVESAFTSFPDMAAGVYPYLPVRSFARCLFRYDTLAYVKGVRCPVMVMHSRDDQLVPFVFGTQLFDAAGEVNTSLHTVAQNLGHSIHEMDRIQALIHTHQVYATAANKYPRPIPTPIKNLRPAQETCEQCHWPEKFIGWVELRRQFFLPDKQNTPWNIRLLVYVGGAIDTKGPVGGIHWHMNVSNHMEYIATDESRQTIPWVRVTNRETGALTLYESQNNPLTPQQKALPMRVLDCVDCHNRPTHIFDSPYRALDDSMWLGRIDPSIPFIKAKAAEALVKAAGAVPMGVLM